MSRDQFEEAMVTAESFIRAIFGIVFGILIGTTIILQGELIGIVIYPWAVCSAIWLGVLLRKSKKKGESEGEG